jgi:SulP family sulfate permease
MCTVANIRSGGQTKISGAIHAVFLFAVVLSLAPPAALIPHAVLAGILFKVGYDIIDFSYLLRAHKGPRWDLCLMVLVLGMTVFADLITAVAVGVVLAALAFVKRLADEQLAAFRRVAPLVTTTEEQALLEEAGSRITLFDFGGPLSFGAAADLGHQVRERTKHKSSSAIVLDFSRLPFVDVSAARAVETIACDARESGKIVYVTGMNDEVRTC